MKCYASIVFALIVISTGLARSVEAQVFKPNAFWFCLVMGLLSVTAAYLFRVNRFSSAKTIGGIAASVVLAFYLYCFITQPEQDASVRVSIAIVAAIGQLAIIFLPAHREPPTR